MPGTLLELLASLRADHEHGGRFEDKSCETDAVAFVIEGATGAHAADVMSRRLWQEMGAEFGAHIGIDPVGAGMFDGVVAAKLSSWPTPQDGEKLLWTIRAFDAVARAIA